MFQGLKDYPNVFQIILMQLSGFQLLKDVPVFLCFFSLTYHLRSKLVTADGFLHLLTILLACENIAVNWTFTLATIFPSA